MDSSVCVSLTNHIHGNKFFNRKVFVTSVVQKTPSKEAEKSTEEVTPAKSDMPCPNNLQASEQESSSDSETEETANASKGPCSKLFTNISEQGKRSAVGSPENSSGKSVKDKKK